MEEEKLKSTLHSLAYIYAKTSIKFTLKRSQYKKTQQLEQTQKKDNSLAMSKTEIHESVNYINQSILKCKELQIAFPTNHDDQRKIAEGFKQKSQAKLNNCVGAIDNI